MFLIQAAILAGGLATRLRPLSLSIPKSMVEIDKKPFLLYQIEMLKSHGITEIVLCIGYLGEKIESYFGNGSRFGVKITYSREKEPMGTGGALKLAGNYLNQEFFVVNGDTYLDTDYRKAFDSFISAKKDKGVKGLMVVYGNKDHIAENNIATDKRNYICAYEKQEGKTNATASKQKLAYVDAGVQLFDKSILKMIPAGKPASLEKEVFPRLIKEKAFKAFITEKRYYDIGTFERLEIFKKRIENKAK